MTKKSLNVRVIDTRIKQIPTFLTFAVKKNQQNVTNISPNNERLPKSQQTKSKERQHHHSQLDLLCHAMFKNLCLNDPKTTPGVECGSFDHIYIIRVIFCVDLKGSFMDLVPVGNRTRLIYKESKSGHSNGEVCALQNSIRVKH